VRSRQTGECRRRKRNYRTTQERGRNDQGNSFINSVNQARTGRVGNERKESSWKDSQRSKRLKVGDGQSHGKPKKNLGDSAY